MEDPIKVMISTKGMIKYQVTCTSDKPITAEQKEKMDKLFKGMVPVSRIVNVSFNKKDE